MTNQEMIQDIFKKIGLENALKLNADASKLSATEIIDEEVDIPDYNPKKDYSDWPVGSPVLDEDQVWILIQPHNAAHYEGRPSTLRALWGLCHTKNPNKAKPFVLPEGTSGMYMKDECVVENGVVYQCIQDNVVYPPSELASLWTVVV